MEKIASLNTRLVRALLRAVVGACTLLFSRMRAPVLTKTNSNQALTVLTSQSPHADDALLRARAMEIRTSERTALLDALVDGVLLVDAHGETRFANAAAALSVQSEGASVSMPTRQQIEAFLNR